MIVKRRRTGSDIASAPRAPCSKNVGKTGARVSWLELCGGGGQLRDRVQTRVETRVETVVKYIQTVETGREGIILKTYYLTVCTSLRNLQQSLSRSLGRSLPVSTICMELCARSKAGGKVRELGEAHAMAGRGPSATRSSRWRRSAWACRLVAERERAGRGSHPCVPHLRSVVPPSPASLKPTK